MDFLDEEVLKFRNAMKKSSHRSLEEGMYINNELVTFSRTELFENKLSIMLPESFIDLPAQLAKQKYISENRPQIIKSSLDTSVNFTFSLLKEELKKENIVSTIEQFKMIIQKIQPANVFYEIEAKADQNLGWFSFKSYALDDNMYNIVYIKSIEGKLLHGIFNCVYGDMAEWKDSALLVIQSAYDLTENKEETKP